MTAKARATVLAEHGYNVPTAAAAVAAAAAASVADDPTLGRLTPEARATVLAEHGYDVPAAVLFIAETVPAWLTAVAAGPVEVVAALLEQHPQLAGARDEVCPFPSNVLFGRVIVLRTRAQSGRHALHIAQAHGHTEVIAFLASAPADADSPHIAYDLADEVCVVTVLYFLL